MKLGTFAQISISVQNVDVSLPFYEILGFEILDKNTVPNPWALLTDGIVYILLYQFEFQSPALNYFAPDMKMRAEYFQERHIPLSHSEDGENNIAQEMLFAPDGLGILLIYFDMQMELLQQQKSTAHCGTFGELSIVTQDIRSSLAFWTQFDYRILSSEEKPYPWAILSDGLMTLGLHQTNDFEKNSLTYFSQNSAERIEYLKNKGINFTDEIKDKNGRTIHATTQAPDGQMFFIFYGEVK
jgi:catechol 2,3-dioxygenase-like lactoylglutathione lyase family enzyme